MDSLEFPGNNGRINPSDLYLARGGGEVSPYRPYLIGDVFDGALIPNDAGKEKKRKIAILQHPCSMRKDGVTLKDSILVAKVSKYKDLSVDDWRTGYFKFMPLPELEGNPQNFVVEFDDLHTVSPTQLDDANRIASLSLRGINLLLQRWVHYMSRVVVPTQTINDATESFVDESDVIEEWCETFAIDETKDAIREAGLSCMEWLRAEHPDGMTYQKMLKDPQSRSTVRKALRAKLNTR